MVVPFASSGAAPFRSSTAVFAAVGAAATDCKRNTSTWHVVHVATCAAWGARWPASATARRSSDVGQGCRMRRGCNDSFESPAFGAPQHLWADPCRGAEVLQLQSP